MVRNIIYLPVLLSIFLCTSVCVGGGSYKTELTRKDAIKIVSVLASKKEYDTAAADVEAIKVNKGVERGPIRLQWLFRYFSGDEIDKILKKEFWIIYFYPKGMLENRTMLGGGFCALVDLYSGEILFSVQD